MEWDLSTNNKRVRDEGENEGEDSKGKKVSRSCNLIDPEFNGFEEIGGKDFGGEVAKSDSCYVDEGRLDVDFDVQQLGSGDDDKLVEKKAEIIEISSDDDDDDDGKEDEVVKQIEQEKLDRWCRELNGFLNDDDLGPESDINLRGIENWNPSNSNSSWLSLAPPSNQYPLDYQSVSQNYQNRNEVVNANGLGFQENVNHQLVNHNNDQHVALQEFLALRERVNDHFLNIHNNDEHVVPQVPYQLQVLRENAHTYAWVDGYKGASSSKEDIPLENEELLTKSGGPFADALKIVIERSKKSRDKLIQWRPKEKVCVNSSSIVPSLMDLSVKVLAENCEAIASLNLVPEFLRQKFADLICNRRNMTFDVLQLLVEGSPTEICIKDCSGITEEQVFKAFKKLEAKCLGVLQLDFCGQCRLDSLISDILAQHIAHLSNLSVISLKGSCCLSDDGLKALARTAPALVSVNLSHCSFLTHAGIIALSVSLGSTLKVLYIDNCLNIDPMLMVPALKNFKHLEVLSVAGNPTVSDQFVIILIDSCGRKLKELDLSDCPGLTNDSLAVIGKGCPNLHALNISSLDNMTDLGLQYLADGCRFIRTFRMCRNTFSDEAIAAFLEASGQSMEELSLNYVSSVGPSTSYSISKCCPKLVSMDLSWCRKLTNEALGLIVDSCLSLKQLKLFGCSQITEVFLNGHSNSQLQIIGQSLTPLWTKNTFT